MAEPLCAPCAKVVVEDRYYHGKMLGEHHRTLAELKSCAESSQGRCPVCRVLWASVQQYCSAPLLHHYLNDWETKAIPSDAKLLLPHSFGAWRTDTIPRNAKVFLQAILQRKVPDNLRDLQPMRNELSDDYAEVLYVWLCNKEGQPEVRVGRVEIWAAFGKPNWKEGPFDVRPL